MREWYGDFVCVVNCMAILRDGCANQRLFKPFVSEIVYQMVWIETNLKNALLRLDRQRYIYIYRERERETETERQRDRETETQRAVWRGRHLFRSRIAVSAVSQRAVCPRKLSGISRCAGQSSSYTPTNRQTDRQTHTQTDTHTHTYTGLVILALIVRHVHFLSAADEV